MKNISDIIDSISTRIKTLPNVVKDVNDSFIKGIIEEPDVIEIPPTDVIEVPMPTRLGDKQRVFTRLVGLLIEEAYRLGYELSFGDAYRDKRCPYGHQNSLHKSRLAIDFNLFKDGVYLDKTEDHTELGVFWESLHPDCRWGGRFKDGNHYSYTHQGMK